MNSAQIYLNICSHIVLKLIKNNSSVDMLKTHLDKNLYNFLLLICKFQNRVISFVGVSSSKAHNLISIRSNNKGIPAAYAR